MAASFEVVIVGGGPVGMGLALDLGRRGVATAIVERHRAPQPIPKGQNLTQRTMEHFGSWGVEDEIRRATVMPPDAPTGGVTAYGTLLGDYWYPWWQRSAVRPYYYTDNERLPQYRTEAVLRDAVADQPSVESRIGWTATELRPTDEGVQVVIEPSGGGPAERITSRYLVGCDGSRSLVRQQAGIDEQRTDHDRTMALLVFRSPELNRLVDHQRDASFFKILHPRHDGYWQFLGRVDADEQWFFHAPIADGAGAAEIDHAALVHRAVGANFEIELDHVGTWDLRIASALTYRAGSVLIAGDAAHSHPPYGGFGLNLGLEDARNLGWKLAATLAGWGGPDLLSSYDAERRPVFTSTAETFIEGAIGQDRSFVQRFDPARDREAFEAEWERQKAGSNAGVGGFEPNYEGSPIVASPGSAQPSTVAPSAVGAHSFEARAGHHLPPVLLSDGRQIDAALGPDHTLIAVGAEPTTVEAFRQAAVDLAVPLAFVTDTAADDRLRYGASLVLVRPDHFVAWVGDAEPDPASVLRRAVGYALTPNLSPPSSSSR